MTGFIYAPLVALIVWYVAVRLELRLLADVSIRNSSEGGSVVLEERQRRRDYG